ncbi:MAG: SIS domain-containing protein [Firmicutes bacterium]|nr:SIS domain-containing protein [Bacillota bacterium]
MGDGRVRQLISIQEQRWSEALHSARVEPLSLSPPLLFVGCGSSYYLAQAAASVARGLGITASAAAAGDVWSDPTASLLGAKGVIVISRSGTTSEALLAIDVIRTCGVPVHVLTCNADTALAAAADYATVLNADDDTVVMIQSFTTMLMWLQAWLMRMQGRDAAPFFRPGLAAEVLGAAEPLVKDLLETIPRRTVYLGAGVRFAIAQEGALKALEMGGAPVLWYEPLEFRHGPWGLIDEGDVVWLLRLGDRAEGEVPLIADIEARGARVVEIVRVGQEYPRHDVIRLPQNVPDLLAGPLAVIPLQLYAWTLAVALGRDPDHPRNLTKVVRIG